MADKIKTDALFQQWMHSWEEDTETERVFRPASYEFKLSRRPRESFELRPDGTLIKGSPTPSDRVQEVQGTWELVDDKLAFYSGSQSQPDKRLLIESVSDDKLVVKKG